MEYWDQHRRCSPCPITRRVDFCIKSQRNRDRFRASSLRRQGVTFTTDATFDLRDLFPTLAPMTYFASCLHVAIRRLQGWEEALPQLSEREQEVLRWAALGKTSWDISMILRISERTVHFHLQQAARKLKVSGRRAACARAIALGLIAL